MACYMEKVEKRRDVSVHRQRWTGKHTNLFRIGDVERSGRVVRVGRSVELGEPVELVRTGERPELSKDKPDRSALSSMLCTLDQRGSCTGLEVKLIPLSKRETVSEERRLTQAVIARKERDSPRIKTDDIESRLGQDAQRGSSAVQESIPGSSRSSRVHLQIKRRARADKRLPLDSIAYA
jgi:hypothetical protein